MKIGILLADDLHSDLRADYVDYSAIFQAMFTRCDASVQCQCFDVQRGYLPESAHDCAAYLITGSRHSATDALPWFDALEQFVMQISSAAIPLVGICFGHQFIARVFGGKTQKNAHGWSIGVHENAVYHQPAWMQPSVESFQLLVSHQEHVSELPDEAILIAGNDLCAHTMYQINQHILAMQAHPEFTKSYSERLLATRRACFDDETYQKGIDSHNKRVDTDLVARWILQFIREANNVR